MSKDGKSRIEAERARREFFEQKRSQILAAFSGNEKQLSMLREFLETLNGLRFAHFSGPAPFQTSNEALQVREGVRLAISQIVDIESALCENVESPIIKPGGNA